MKITLRLPVLPKKAFRVITKKILVQHPKVLIFSTSRAALQKHSLGWAKAFKVDFSLDYTCTLPKKSPKVSR